MSKRIFAILFAACRIIRDPTHCLSLRAIEAGDRFRFVYRFSSAPLISAIMSSTAARLACAKCSAPNFAYFSCLYAAMMPLEEFTIAPRPSSLKKCYEICTLSSLCTITWYQNEGFRHYLSKRLAHLRVCCTDNRSNVAVLISHAGIRPLCYLFSYQLIQRLSIDQAILKLSAGRV